MENVKRRFICSYFILIESNLNAYETGKFVWTTYTQLKINSNKQCTWLACVARIVRSSEIKKILQ